MKESSSLNEVVFQLALVVKVKNIKRINADLRV